jgi:hypothetical protein
LYGFAHFGAAQVMSLSMSRLELWRLYGDSRMYEAKEEVKVKSD